MPANDEIGIYLQAVSEKLKQMGKLPASNEMLCAALDEQGAVRVEVKPKSLFLGVDFEIDLFTPGNAPVKPTPKKRLGMLYNAWQYLRTGLGYEMITDSTPHVQSVLEPVSGKVQCKLTGQTGQLKMQWVTDDGVFVMVQTTHDDELHITSHAQWDVL